MTNMLPDSLDSRDVLRRLASDILERLRNGGGPTKVESEHVDVKEEAGRRDRSGGLLVGTPQNPAAAEQLAGEVRCFSNTPGGGVIVVGVEDRTWRPLGTELDEEWLRQRINDLTGCAPYIDVTDVNGHRVLVVYVAESPDPVEDLDRRIRWRIGDQCRPVDRGEWWAHRAQRIGVDVMAASTKRTLAEVGGPAIDVVRRYLRAGGADQEVVDAAADQMLTHLGVLRPDGTLSRAGALVLCPTDLPFLTLSRLDVPGGDVLGVWEPPTGMSLIEALEQTEVRIDAWNAIRPESRGFVEAGQRDLPVRAVREAILNHLTHRDWFLPTPTTIRWVDFDATLEVESPGGFTGGVTPQNVLTTRHARYPALADLFRAMRLVDRQGVGVPRMYQQMIAEGHRPPVIELRPGPAIRTTLAGEPLLVPLARVLASIEPEPRRRDVRVAVLVDALLRRPYLTVGEAAVVLQSSEHNAEQALEAALGCTTPTIKEGRLVVFERGVWRIRPEVADAVHAGRLGKMPPSGELAWFRAGTQDVLRRAVTLWLSDHGRIASGDLAMITGVATSNASNALTNMADLVERGPGAGRSAHFIAQR